MIISFELNHVVEEEKTKTKKKKKEILKRNDIFTFNNFISFRFFFLSRSFELISNTTLHCDHHVLWCWVRGENRGKKGRQSLFSKEITRKTIFTKASWYLLLSFSLLFIMCVCCFCIVKRVMKKKRKFSYFKFCFLFVSCFLVLFFYRFFLLFLENSFKNN